MEENSGDLLSIKYLSYEKNREGILWTKSQEFMLLQMKLMENNMLDYQKIVGEDGQIIILNLITLKIRMI